MRILPYFLALFNPIMLILLVIMLSISTRLSIKNSSEIPCGKTSIGIVTPELTYAYLEKLDGTIIRSILLIRSSANLEIMLESATSNPPILFFMLSNFAKFLEFCAKDSDEANGYRKGCNNMLLFSFQFIHPICDQSISSIS